MTTTTEPAWRLESVNILPIPQVSKTVLERRGFELLGPFADALAADQDVGLKPQEREKCRAFIDDQAKAESPEEEEEEEEETYEENRPSENGIPLDILVNPTPEQLASTPHMSADTMKANVVNEKVVAGQLPDRAEAWEKINVAKVRHSEAVDAFLISNNRTKAAKKMMEAAAEEVFAAIEWANTPQVAPQPTLFDGAQTVPQAPEDESWRDFPLERWTAYDLPKGVIKKLAEASPPITTVGELAQFQQPKPGSTWVPKFTDIAGIGKGAAEKIGAASEQFWIEWRREGKEQFAKEKMPRE